MNNHNNDPHQQNEMPVPMPPSESGNTPKDEPVEFKLAKATATKEKNKAGTHTAKKKSVSKESEGWLTVDVYDTDDAIVVQSAVAGVAPRDVEIDASPDSLTIRGERKRTSKAEDEDYLYQECYWGKFSRSIVLPQEIDPKSAKASFDNGILTVTLPKLDRQEKTKIKVE